MTIRWTTILLDFPADVLDAANAFWPNVTGTTMSTPWSGHPEFASLVPGHGDPYLALQRLEDGAARVHPDFHVDDLDAEASRAIALGAAKTREEPGLVVLASPTGLPFCLVRHGRGQSEVPPPTARDGQASRLDQLCIDVPPEAFDRELAFWTGFTDWPRSSSDTHEFRRLLPPPGLPVHFLLQRLDTAAPDQSTSAHLDFSCADVEAEADRHTATGAARVRRHRHWQVMRDPAGLEYCLTDKPPDGSWVPNA
ncbi:VOC family protein [Glycomyces sp. NPDC047369]